MCVHSACSFKIINFIYNNENFEVNTLRIDERFEAVRDKIYYFKTDGSSILVCLSMVGMIGASIVNGLNIYLYKDWFGDVKIQSIAGGLSVFYIVIVFAITQPIANKLGKKEWCMYGAGFSTLVYLVMFFVPVHNSMLFIVLNGICYMGASGMQVLIWAMVNDAIDYHELQTGERNEAIMYSAYSFFRKVASAVSGSCSSFVLGMIGYNITAGAVQTAEVTQNIWKAYTGCYVLGYGLAVAVLFVLYPLTKEKTAEMTEQLRLRRAEKEIV